jgi:manganese transport protein
MSDTVTSSGKQPNGPPMGRAHLSIAVPSAGFWRTARAVAGPGFLVAVGYMDPGNWATALAGGSAFGYLLLSVVLISSLFAMLLQSLAARLGIVTGLDLAQACRSQYSRPTRLALWLMCELAIIACDLAEVIGTAIALELLFGIPLVIGVCLTAFDVLLILALQQRGYRWLEAFIIALLAIIAGCFAVEMALAQPGLAELADGLIPRAQIVTNPTALFIAIGIIGATVMPHNLYLHSALIQTRRFDRDPASIRRAIRFATLDSSVALTFALAINAAILILAAASFHSSGQTQVAEIQDAFRLLSPTLGAAWASTLFAIALLASGQNSTVTATLAGQIVMEGFLDWRVPPWLRRSATRLLAIIPAVAVAASYGSSGTARLLVASQVVLSLQLPFAVIPLIQFTGDSRLMGGFATGRRMKAAAWAIAAIIIVLNVTLLASLV